MSASDMPGHFVITKLTQLTKGLRVPPEQSATLAAELQRLKWFLWHGNVFRSLQTVDAWQGFVARGTAVPGRRHAADQGRVRAYSQESGTAPLLLPRSWHSSHFPWHGTGAGLPGL